MKTIDQLYAEYCQKMDENQVAYRQFRVNELTREEYQKTIIDYNYFDMEMQLIFMAKYNLSLGQYGYICGAAHERFHNCYDDIFYGLDNMIEFVIGFRNVK